MTLAAVIERSKTDREAWKYTSLEGLEGVFVGKYAGAVVADTTPHLTTPARGEEFRRDMGAVGPQLVFLNGVWQPSASRLCDLPPDILQGDAIEGYRLTLAAQTCLAISPLELLFINTPGNEATETNTKLRISLGASGRLTLIEKHGTASDNDIQNAGTNFFAHIIETGIELGEQAKLVHGKIVNPQSDASSVHLSQTNVRVAKGAFYDNFTLLGGGKLTRNAIDVTLAGERAQCRLYGAMLMRGAEHADTTTRVVHAAPNASSRQHYKSVIGGKARGVFKGKIVVNEGAQKADGYQLCRALLLSDQAEMDAKPELEIYADDVSCSHGCSIGDLDEQALFYLRSRGIGEDEARALLIEAFVGEIVNEIQSSELRKSVSAAVNNWLRGSRCISEHGLIHPPSRGRLGGGANSVHDNHD